MSFFCPWKLPFKQNICETISSERRLLPIQGIALSPAYTPRQLVPRRLLTPLQQVTTYHSLPVPPRQGLRTGECLWVLVANSTFLNPHRLHKGRGQNSCFTDSVPVWPFFSDLPLEEEIASLS